MIGEDMGDSVVVGQITADGRWKEHDGTAAEPGLYVVCGGGFVNMFHIPTQEQVAAAAAEKAAIQSAESGVPMPSIEGKTSDELDRELRALPAQSPRVQEFLAAVALVCKQYGYSIAHEDSGGAFEIVDDEDNDWLLSAHDCTLAGRKLDAEKRVIRDEAMRLYREESARN